MKAYLSWFFKAFDYPPEGAEALMSGYREISENAGTNQIFEDILEAYRQNYNCDYKVLLVKCEEIAARCGVHEYTVKLLAFICMSKQLRENYRERGLALDIWFDSMCDLKYKLIECKLVKGIYGSFVASWFDRFFKMTRFALGRLQFELVPFKRNYEKDGKVLTPESQVINIHIPRTETPLDRQSCLAAYDKARAFFKEDFRESPMAFVCHSWLLFGENRNLLKETSNIRLFMDDFDIIEGRLSDEGDYASAWRLFDMDYTGNVDDFPENTSLRRAYKAYMKNGGRLGSGSGVFFA